MTVIPEYKAALLLAAERQVAARAGAGAPAAPAAPRRSVRGRRWRRPAGPLIVVAMLGVSGIAVGGGFVVSRQTERQSARLVDAPKPTEGSVSKLGNPMVRTAAEIAATLPYPPGMRDDYDWSKYSAGATLGTGGEARREIQMMSETRASCLWRRYYLKSYDAHNVPQMQAAAKILAQSHYWPATRAIMGHSVQPGGGFFAAFDAAAQRGQIAKGGRREVEINCYDHTMAELTGKAPLVWHSSR